MTDLKELALKVTEVMQEAGYSNVTAWRSYLDAMLPLVRYHAERVFTDYNADVTADFCNRLAERRMNGDINRKNATKKLATISRLTHFYDTGKIDYDIPKKVSKFKLNDYYDSLLDDYITHNELHPNTRGDVIWVARKFFSWLVKEGHSTIESISATEIQSFLVHCSGHMASSSIHNVLLYMRKICGYLYEHGHLSNPHTALLSMKVSRESKLYPPMQTPNISAKLSRRPCLTIAR